LVSRTHAPPSAQEATELRLFPATNSKCRRDRPGAAAVSHAPRLLAKTGGGRYVPPLP
jgi:hypothetical protein